MQFQQLLKSYWITFETWFEGLPLPIRMALIAFSGGFFGVFLNQFQIELGSGFTAPFVFSVVWRSAFTGGCTALLYYIKRSPFFQQIETVITTAETVTPTATTTVQTATTQTTSTLKTL